MTRGEADRIANMAYEDGINRTEAESVVDILVALGLIKLDEPEEEDSPDQIVIKAASALYAAGFKIVKR